MNDDEIRRWAQNIKIFNPGAKTVEVQAGVDDADNQVVRVLDEEDEVISEGLGTAEDGRKLTEVLKSSGIAASLTEWEGFPE
jgi:uncharacterized protein YaiI (UPF0178 family)